MSATSILHELADMLSPTQREAFSVFLEAELARRAGSEADFDETVRARMNPRRWEKAILSIPKELLFALFDNAEAHEAVRH
jgi:hypothetical protein